MSLFVSPEANQLSIGIFISIAALLRLHQVSQSYHSIRFSYAEHTRYIAYGMISREVNYPLFFHWINFLIKFFCLNFVFVLHFYSTCWQSAICIKTAIHTGIHCHIFFWMKTSWDLSLCHLKTAKDISKRLFRLHICGEGQITERQWCVGQKTKKWAGRLSIIELSSLPEDDFTLSIVWLEFQQWSGNCANNHEGTATALCYRIQPLVQYSRGRERGSS